MHPSRIGCNWLAIDCLNEKSITSVNPISIIRTAPDQQLVWERKADELNQSMIFLMNSKNKIAKKDLRLTYFQGNNTAYPPGINAMARYLSTQYPNNKLANQRRGKMRDKKKGDDPESKEKDCDIGSTASVYVDNTTTTEEFSAPSGAPSIAVHVSETNVQLSSSPHTMEEILGAHPMNDDDFWDNTNPTGVLIDTANSEEIMTGSHITKFHTHKHAEPVTTELLNKISNVPIVYDAVQKCQLNPSNKSKNSNMLSKTSNMTHTRMMSIS